MCSILRSLWLWATLVKVRRELVAFRKLSLLGYLNVFCFLNWANPGLFFVYFGLFKQTTQFLQQMNVKNVMSIQ